MAKAATQKTETKPAKTAGSKTPVSDATSALSRAYDEVPYSSYPFAQTSPELLQGIGKLFGLNAPDPSKARILEIGCAAGNNIIAIAARFPESTCVGFDYAVRQIETGQKQVKDMGLSNIELKHLSVMDMDKTMGKFDYIICHGVLSWVPPEVQEKIIEVCSTHLTPDGIAYVSYNTLPGWNSVRSVREMMMYHTAMYNSPAEKAQAARQILKFIGDSARSNNNVSMAQIIERENEILTNQPDYYLLHEHLEENNYQFYFHQFMATAAKNDLQYLAETSLEKMFSGNFSPEIATVLATSNDIVRTEQYMDYIYDRRFRSTLLCHKDRILNRNLKSIDLLEGYVFNRFNMPEGFKEYDMAAPMSFKFPAQSGMLLTTDDPLAQCILKELQAASTQAVSVKKLCGKVHDRLKKLKHRNGQVALEQIEDAICQLLMRYLFIGGIYYYLQPLAYTTEVSKKPATSKLARYQATIQNWISSQRQEHITITPFDNKLISLLDGTRDQAALVKDLMPAFVAKELMMNEKDEGVTDMKTVESRLPEFVNGALSRYAVLGMLVK